MSVDMTHSSPSSPPLGLHDKHHNALPWTALMTQERTKQRRLVYDKKDKERTPKKRMSVDESESPGNGFSKTIPSSLHQNKADHHFVETAHERFANATIANATAGMILVNGHEPRRTRESSPSPSTGTGNASMGEHSDENGSSSCTAPIFPILRAMLRSSRLTPFDYLTLNWDIHLDLTDVQIPPSAQDVLHFFTQLPDTFWVNMVNFFVKGGKGPFAQDWERFTVCVMDGPKHQRDVHRCNPETLVSFIEWLYKSHGKTMLSIMMKFRYDFIEM